MYMKSKNKQKIKFLETGIRFVVMQRQVVGEGRIEKRWSKGTNWYDTCGSCYKNKS